MILNKTEKLLYKGNIINSKHGYIDEEDIAQGIFEEMDRALNKLYSKVSNPNYMELLEYGIDEENDKTWTWFITDNKEEFELVYQKNTGHIYLRGDLTTICIDGCIYKDPSKLMNL